MDDGDDRGGDCDLRFANPRRMDDRWAMKKEGARERRMDERLRPSEIAKTICDHVNYNEPLRRIAAVQRGYSRRIFLDTFRSAAANMSRSMSANL